ncbi:MAG TPA: ABC transporter substrate-binding protein [Clostridia bacterium]|jgi:peptide/nickel transport system substrate-binding protein|nr:ABC transporter substrate-binding protein [Clostridia bacterium]HQO55649.1 ABC transporter substrate-binding protein [Clostridia bacterium]HUM60172.1 ABC transporter substrate-binding protein [Clostridia bacterium]
MKKILSFLLILTLAIGILPGLAEGDLVQLPRNETLSYFGLAWGTASSYNPLEAGGNVGMGIGGGRFLVYESLYMYNMLTNENEPLIAESAAVLSEDGTRYTVKLKENVTFNDGTPCLAKDVKFSYDVHDTTKFADIVTPSPDIFTYIKEVVVVDDYTLEFVLNQDNYNPLLAASYLTTVPILPEAVWMPRWEKHGPAMTKLFNEDTVATGPYKHFASDAARQILIRVDTYWGQAENMFGKLAKPKYISHDILANNDAGAIAFGEGRIDINQQFLANVETYMNSMKDENGNSLVNTYYNEPPHHLGWGMPSMVINLNKPGLSDPVVRKALALCLDYEAIAINAMSGYTAPMKMAYINAYLFEDYIDWDNEEMQALMWDTTDLSGNVAEANRLLDEAGYLDVDGDGLREMPDGSKIEWKASCPAGWSDWNLTLEALVESAKAVGLNVITYFPEMAIYFNDLYYGHADIGMWTMTPTASVAMPWQAAQFTMYSKGIPPIGEYAARNYNRFHSDRLDELVELSMTETDMEVLREYYTEINIIWLENLPYVPFMYRPQVFQTTYAGYWTGFVSGKDNSTIPPMLCMDQAGIRELYLLEPTGRE